MCDCERTVECVANAAAAVQSSEENSGNREYLGARVHCMLKVWFSSSM